MSEPLDPSSLLQRHNPSGELPGAWQEDLEANIAKHRHKISVLQEELNTEIAYVRSLELMLQDAKDRTAAQARGSESHSQSADGGDEESPGPPGAGESTEADGGPRSADSSAHSSVASTPESEERPPLVDKTGFVTVINVCGLNKATAPAAPGSQATADGDTEPGADRLAATERQLDGSENDNKSEQNGPSKSGAALDTAETESASPLARRKVPPKPPPKTFRRPTSIQPESAAQKMSVTKSQSFDAGLKRPELITEKPARVMRAAPAPPAPQVPKYWRSASLVDKQSPVTEEPRSRPTMTANEGAGGTENPAGSIANTSEVCADNERTVEIVDGDEGTNLDITPEVESKLPLGSLEKSPVDDGYGTKDRSKSSFERRQRQPLKIEPPVVPVQKSFSRESIGSVQKSCSRESLNRFVTKDSLGKFPSRESLTNFPARENQGKYASKESLKDSGTSSPRNASPKFFETKITRSASQSSSGSLPAGSAPLRQYMEGIEEPLYDTVAPDPEPVADRSAGWEYAADTLKSASSGEVDLSSVANDTLRSEASAASAASVASATSGTSSSEGGAAGTAPRASLSGQTPPNYVNIDFFIARKPRQKPRTETEEDSEDEEDVAPLLRAISVDDASPERETPPRRPLHSASTDDVFAPAHPDEFTPTSVVDGTPAAGTRRESNASQQSESQRIATYKHVVKTVVESEAMYVECLSVTVQYMKVLKSTIATSQPVISQDDFSAIFFKVPDLHTLHDEFLRRLRAATSDWDGYKPIGQHFKFLAENMGVYGAYLQNYRHALETVRRCSSSSAHFAEITRCIKLRSLKGQSLSLEQLLHKPVARVQQTAPVLKDLLKYLPSSHPDYRTMGLAHALTMTQSFLNRHSVDASKPLCFERMQRHVVKNSFIVEMCDNHRKLRHLFLFNDVIVCAKYKASGRNDKFTFEVKWLIPLPEIVTSCEEPPPEAQHPASTSLVTLKSQASTVRDQIRAQERHHVLQGSKRTDQKTEKQRKKLADLEAQLVLASPNLPFRVSSRNGKQQAMFFLSSDFDRAQWTEAVHVLQANTPPSLQAQPVQFDEVQAWISNYRRDLQTNMGSYLMRTGRDESLLVGDLHVMVHSVGGLQHDTELFICFEVDSYGHFFRKAKTKPARGLSPCWEEDFIVELEGSHSLRILCYENEPREAPQLRGRARLELSRSWLSTSMQERVVNLEGLSLTLSLKYASYEMTKRRPPPGKSNRLFGSKIQDVCRREDRSVPFIVTSCLREVERRGAHETGIYRVSGSATDINRLKKLFETNIYEAEQLIKEVDIHSVTGLLKLYLRELPEALFTDELYASFFEAFGCGDHELRRRHLLKLFSRLPQLNQSIIVYMIEHLIRVNRAEALNKMSLHNLATVFGPTLLRPGPQKDGAERPDLLAAGTVDVMAQAGILYFFLQRRSNDEPIQISLEPNSRLI